MAYCFDLIKMQAKSGAQLGRITRWLGERKGRGGNSPIGYDVLANAIDRHAGEAIEFAFAVAIFAKLLDEDPIRIEDLNAMIR